MSKYMYIFKNTWFSAFQYRANTFMVLLFIFLRLVAEIFFWNVYYQASGREIVSGFSYKGMITYYLVMNLFANTLAQSTIAYTVSNDIKNGFISKYMIMPIDLTGYYFVKDLAQKTYEASIGITALLPVVLLFHDSMMVYARLHDLPFILLCSLMSVILSFLIFINFSLLTFWFTDISNLYMAVMILTDFLSGGFFPLSILLAGVYKLVHVLPFYYTIFFPVNMMTSDTSVGYILQGFLIQTVWIVLLGMLAISLYKKGRKDMRLREYKERAILYAKVVKMIYRNSICSQLAYPANLFMAIFIQSSFMAVQLVFIDSIYRQVDSIRGWNKYELIFYTITVILIDSLFISISYLSLRDFPALIREGRLDFMMTKPISCRFLISTKWIDTGAMLQVLQNICMLSYPLYKLHKIPTLAEVILYISGVIAGVFVLYCFYFTISCIAFWVIKADFIDNIYGLAYMFALKPINIYPRIIRIILCSILPLGLLFYVPANAIKSIGFAQLSLLIVIGVLYFIFGNFVWKLGIKKYSSAG